MQSLSTDIRPEVRNSGVRTLYSVVVSHGAKLSEAQWRQCFWDILFPLLRTVHHMSVTSSREEASTYAPHLSVLRLLLICSARLENAWQCKEPTIWHIGCSRDSWQAGR